MIELRGVSRWYGDVVAVNAVSCTIGPGITGLLGPNGAGKTTLLHLAAGLLAPSAGDILLDGSRLRGDPAIYARLGFVPERESVPGFLTGAEFVRASAKLQHLPDVETAVARAVAMVDLESAQHRKTATYSKGMRQRIKLAASLVHDPQTLLLDEPFSGMDPRQRSHMMDLLRGLVDGRRVILISSHILEELSELADSVLVMVAGRLAASGHYRDIRRLMTDRPHAFTLRSSDDRRLASVLLAQPFVFSAELGAAQLSVRTSDLGAFARALPAVARGSGIRLHEVLPTDESLESVFSYLVER